MTRILTTDNEDGTLTLSGFAGSVTIATFECDVCESGTPVADRYVVWAKRYSDGELTEVMWVCEGCAPEVGADHHTEGTSS